MHAADPERSPILMRTLSLLRLMKGAGATTAEIASYTGSMNVGTDVSALRNNKRQRHLIRCVNEGRNKNGRKVFRYFYEGRA